VRRLAVILLVIIISAASSAIHARAEECVRKLSDAVGWVPPPEGVVQNASDAVRIAHIAWSSINREARISESRWSRSMKASLAGNVWKVSRRRPADTMGGDLIISISKCDGRILDVLLTQ
jgi:hypothetical protein